MSGRIAAPTTAAVADAARRLLAGELVAFPTETVYGLGADARNREAVHRIFAAKGRPSDHPVIVHLQHVAQVDRWAREFPDGARRLAAAFWPGPLTLILPRADHVDDAITGGQDSVGLRMPAHPVAKALLAAFAALGGDGNRGAVGQPVRPRISDHGAACRGRPGRRGGDDSRRRTLCRRHRKHDRRVHRPRARCCCVPAASASTRWPRVLGRAPKAPGADAPRASGTLASHYAPHAPARLVARGDLLSRSCRAAPRAASALPSSRARSASRRIRR